MPETLPASARDLAWIAPAALQAHAIDAARELDDIAAKEPWRVRVSNRGEAVLLDRWRDHVNDCAIIALWCEPSRVPSLVSDIGHVARSRGFDRLVGPLVPERALQPYLNAGLHVAERVSVMRLDTRRTAFSAPADVTSAPAGVNVRSARISDLPDLVGVDAACFSDFWRYDLRLLTRLASSGRIAVAREDDRVIGYTLATVEAASGSLGRLAVLPDVRRRGIGRSLAVEAVEWLKGRGVRSVVLSTQEGNSAAVALYRSLGFAATPGRLMVCVSDALNVFGEER